MFEMVIVYGWALLMVAIFSFAILIFIMVPYVNYRNSTSSSITTPHSPMIVSGLPP